MTHRGERLLVVEDERAQRVALQRYLEGRGFVVDAVATGEEAVERVGSRDYAVVITDLRLPGIDGLEVTRRVTDFDAEIGVLLSTAYASVESAVEALRLGAHDYLLKPLILDEVGRKVDNLLERRDLLRENIGLRRAIHGAGPGRAVVSESAVMQDVLRWVNKAAASDANVLIVGETGTGKEVVARTIHELRPADAPFLAVNIAALPETMVESELFGHERGAFTGAHGKREGILRAAGRGTVFLDEIGELAPSLQAKLLRALEAREVRPLGSDRAVPMQARILAATHRDLKRMVAEGTFREDLYYRLNILVIELPPLRDRPEDIPALCRVLLDRHGKKRHGGAPPTLTTDAMRALCAYRWPGNVRELSNVLERALLLCDGDRIDVEHLPRELGDAGEGGDDLHLSGAVERFERGHIAMVLRLSKGNRELAAQHLGISPATLYRRLEKLELKGFAVERGAE